MVFANTMRKGAEKSYFVLYWFWSAVVANVLMGET